MIITEITVSSVEQLKNHIYHLKCYSPALASSFKAGQFLNLKVNDTTFPLLRRPFSISDVNGDEIYLLFNVHGEGTKMLTQKVKGDLLDVLAPLGCGYNTDGDFDTAVLIGGGLGVAPFPLLTKQLQGKEIFTFLGGRSEADIVTYGLKNVFVSTDDGSLGEQGTVVKLFLENLDKFDGKKIKVFACGPTPMLKALQNVLLENNIDGEISTECAMACGFGICQGCPIEDKNNSSRYLLVCKDGPVFNVKDVIL